MKNEMPALMPNNSDEGISDPNWHWQAHLNLVFSQRGARGTRLTRNRHRGPLYVQKPFYPEGKELAHIYLLHPPGGLVSGDTLTLDISVEEKAQGLVTTPGATRMYRARESSPVQRQYTQLRVDQGAVLEWFPMEAIVYNQAHAELETKITLQDESKVFAWEITCFGLPASAEKFEKGFFKQRYIIEKKAEKNNKPLLIDNLVVDQLCGKDDYSGKNHKKLFTASAGMQNKTVSGFFISGPFNSSSPSDKSKQSEYAKQRELLTESLRGALQSNNLENLISITWVNNFCIARYLGDSAFQARKGFTLLWQHLRPALTGRKACEPRIWLT